jgi:lipooligosaccharide transport system permease protein
MKLGELFALPTLSRRTIEVWRRNAKVFMKTYKVNFIPPVVEPILYLLAFGYGLGSIVQPIDGHPYVNWIAPALIGITIMNSSFFECTYASFVRMYFQRTFDAIIATPLNVEEVIAGEVLWGATRSVISAGIMLAVLTVFGLATYPLAILVIPLAFIGGLMFAVFGMCFTAITPRIDSLNYPTSLFIAPMFLVSGTFFPLDHFPSGVQTFANLFVPLVPVVKISRALSLGSLDLSLLLSLAWILAVTGIFFIIAVNMMKKRLIV